MVDSQSIEATAGIGLENPEDFTYGIQASYYESTGTSQDGSGNTGYTPGFQAFQAGAGGEKWLSPQWAFRMGLEYLYQNNNGNLPVPTFYLPAIDPGVSLESATLTAGVGYKDKVFYGDLGLSFGDMVRDNSPDTAFATQAGVQFAAGVLLN